MDGFYKINRKLLNSDLWLLEPFTKGQAWLDLIGLASYKKSQIRIKNGEMQVVERGECAWSQLKLAERWQWSRGKVNRFIEYLKSEKMIQQKICPNLTIIKILNYKYYQDDTTNSTTNSTINSTHYKKEKKEKKSNISLSNSSTRARVGKREREILKSYCKRKHVENANAYIRKVIDNGDWVDLVKEEQAIQCKSDELKRLRLEQKQREQAELNAAPPENIHEFMQNVRRNLRRG